MVQPEQTDRLQRVTATHQQYCTPQARSAHRTGAGHASLCLPDRSSIQPARTRQRLAHQQDAALEIVEKVRFHRILNF